MKDLESIIRSIFHLHHYLASKKPVRIDVSAYEKSGWSQIYPDGTLEHAIYRTIAEVYENEKTTSRWSYQAWINTIEVEALHHSSKEIEAAFGRLLNGDRAKKLPALFKENFWGYVFPTPISGITIRKKSK